MQGHAVLQQFNHTIGHFIKALDNYTLEQICRQPQPGRWSLGQMYRHIIDDTAWFVQQMKACLATTHHINESMHEDAQAMFAANAFPDILIEGPATNTYIPQPPSKDELLQELLTIQNEVNSLDFSAPSGKTLHPGLLYFNATEWLQFAEMHIRHHFRQKQRIDNYLFK
jgi:hypothetical protein